MIAKERSNSTADKVRNRCFIVDPVCAITYGHSLNSLYYFADLAEKYFDSVVLFASRHLPAVEGGRFINRFFEFYYDQYIKIARLPLSSYEMDIERFASMDDAAAFDFFRFISEHAIGAGDVIMFPSADYYTLMGATNVLRRLPVNQRPSLLIRLINVMENVNSLGPNVLPLPVQRAVALKREGTNISFSAETPKYARRLRELAEVEVVTAPYPSFPSSLVPLNRTAQFTVLCGGSGRADKGFFRLVDIVEATNIVGADVRFVIQNLHPREQADNISYINRLYSIPNVTLLPGVLPYNEITEAYANAHASLMPYDTATYELRGSAMLMESILYGRPCIGQSGTAFAEQIQLYRCGEVCGSNSEMAAAIAAMASTDRSKLAENAAVSRALYTTEVDRAYKDWIAQL